MCHFVGQLKASAQDFKYTFSGSVSKIYFPNWVSGNTKEFGIGYCQKIGDKIWIGADINFASGGLIVETLPSDSNIYERIFYNVVTNRSMIIFDSKFNYSIFEGESEKVFLLPFAGVSFILGSERFLESIWYGPPFHEATGDVHIRQHFGVNGGMELLYFPLKHFGMGLYLKGHLYTKYDPDFNVGLNLNYRFGNKISS